MKGFMIYESPFMGEMYVRAIGVIRANYTFESSTAEDASVSLSGHFSRSSQAKCSKEDTYDFETGALISLMKMCGVDKVVRACNEAFSEDTFKTYATIYERELNELKKENEKLKNEVRIIKDALNTWKERYRDLNTANGDLVCENHKLKTDCEKLQKGYIDTDMIFCGGRQNGKQHTFLVDLFKKIDQKRVDAAYKEAYNTILPVWQKEALKQTYEIRKESKEKTELPRTLDINGVNYRKCDERGRVVWFTSQPERLSFNANYIDTDALEALRGWRKEPISKREKMWDKILEEGRTPVYVKREDILDFLKECERTGIKWSSGKSPLETMPFHMSEGYDGVYFFVMTTLDNEFRHVMSWWCTACPDEVEAAIHYIRPMRWDLFEKGRIVVKVNKENHSEFCTEVFNHFTKVGISSFNHACKFGYFVFNKDTNYVERVLVSDYDTYKEINHHKVVDWEDVR